jgi:hypothetical protein
MDPRESSDRVVAALKPGECRLLLAAGPGAQVVIVLRERSAVIKYFGETTVSVRGELFLFGAVAVIVVAVRVGHAVPMFYGAFLDYCAGNGGELLQTLCNQDILPLYFHGDNGRRDRTFVVANPLAAACADWLTELREMPPWNGTDFQRAVSGLTARHSTVGDLWLAMPQQ